jgi:predicted methyltransferase
MMIGGKRMRAGLMVLALLASMPCAMAQQTAQATVPPALQAAVAGAWRDPANVARDGWRHPAQTLTYFGVQPEHTVIEVTPGSGWYSEILAPYLRKHGHYVAALVDPQVLPEGRGRDYQQRAGEQLRSKFAAQPALYDKVTTVSYAPQTPVFGADASADVVLTFRNVHNWRAAGQDQGMFAGFYKVLKHGGVLGVVEHRAKADVAADDKSGYVGQQQVIALAEAAGFKLAGSSEINANARDSKDYPGGVWTLPPTSRHEPADSAKYQAIGESDRMTLKFIKP